MDSRRKKKRRSNLYRQQNGRCAYCQNPMLITAEKVNCQYNPRMATIEHIDDRFSTLRGTFQNQERTILVCYCCNNEANREMQKRIPLDELRRRSGSYPSDGSYHADK